MRIRALAIIPILAGALVSCRPEVVVRLTTRVLLDGGIQRRIEIEGREPDGSLPGSPAWLENEARVELADREAWGRVEERPGSLIADGFFASADRIPGTLAHRTEAGAASDRVKVTLTGRDLVVLKRWTYQESWSDPYGPEESSKAVDRLLELLCRVLREETHRELGEGVDTRAAEAFIRTDGRALLLDVLAVRTRKPAQGDLAERNRQWAKVLRRRGVSPAAYDDMTFWSDQAEAILGWARTRIADALSTKDRTVAPSEIPFPPSVSAMQARPDALDQMLGRALGPEGSFDATVKPLIDTLAGYYGGGGGARIRFEVRVELPGRLLRTNGTPDGAAGALWLLREEDLTSKERVLKSESVVLDDERLRSIGARRDLDPMRLLQITDLLLERDRTGMLVQLLAEAVTKGSLSFLREEGGVPEDLQPLARELAELLDPNPAGADSASAVPDQTSDRHESPSVVDRPAPLPPEPPPEPAPVPPAPEPPESETPGSES